MCLAYIKSLRRNFFLLKVLILCTFPNYTYVMENMLSLRFIKKTISALSNKNSIRDSGKISNHELHKVDKTNSYTVFNEILN